MDTVLMLSDQARHWFENISILIMLLLLYNFIPGRIYQDKRVLFSILVGIIFSSAAVMGIFVPWTGTTHPSIGLNGVLIPLAGYVGGLLSAGIITCFLLFFRIVIEGGRGATPDVIIAVMAAIVGSGFYALRRYHVKRINPFLELLIFSALFAGITQTVLTFFPFDMDHPAPPGLFPHGDTEYVIFFGLLLLGIVIQQIDRKKNTEEELTRYQGHLETLVRDRTVELSEANALQRATIESTADGIVVISLSGIVSRYNQTAKKMLDIRSSEEINETDLDIVHLLRYHTADPDVIRDDFWLCQAGEDLFSTEVVFRSGRVYDLSVTRYQVGDEVRGRVLNFRDITAKKHTEEMLISMNQKLLLLSGIMRHDILNQITAMKLYVYLLKTVPTDPDAPEYLNRMTQTLHLMQQHVESTGEYQDVGIHEPAWQDPFAVFQKATTSFTEQHIIFSTAGISGEILADPLLERVFYNLIDNSVRHGGSVTTIMVSLICRDHEVVLMYEDNGAGIALDDKDKIFEKGFGKHTGFGMFLIRELLSITGLSITETGVPGSGVRFEVLIPEHAFRYPV